MEVNDSNVRETVGEQSRGLGDGRCGSSHVRSTKFKDCLYRLSDIQ